MKIEIIFCAQVSIPSDRVLVSMERLRRKLHKRLSAESQSPQIGSWFQSTKGVVISGRGPGLNPLRSGLGFNYQSRSKRRYNIPFGSQSPQIGSWFQC